MRVRREEEAGGSGRKEFGEEGRGQEAGGVCVWREGGSDLLEKRDSIISVQALEIRIEENIGVLRGCHVPESGCRV